MTDNRMHDKWPRPGEDAMAKSNDNRAEPPKPFRRVRRAGQTVNKAARRAQMPQPSSGYVNNDKKKPPKS